MYVRLTQALSPDQLQELRNEFMKAMPLTVEDFYFEGPLIVVPEQDREVMPVKDDLSFWIAVNLWRSYFGPGYMRGNPKLFARVAEWLEKRLEGAEIYYGNDVDSENVALFNSETRKKLLRLYRASRRNRPRR